MSSSSAPLEGQTGLSILPVELLHSIWSFLSNNDIKSLRLTCKLLAELASLRLSRVFLSPNPLNIQVFQAVADHPTFREKITEIIWDDACLIEEPTLDDVYPDELREDNYIDSDEECPIWFVDCCEENLDELTRRKGWDVDRPDHIARAKQVAAQPPLKVCWQYYHNLLQQQADVLASENDVDAFIYGLKQFPALQRVTITPAAHGRLHAPLYRTPMIRAFPYGFNYPIPRGWPTSTDLDMPPYASQWTNLSEKGRNKWRGFRVVTRVLAQHKHNVQEFVIDDHQLPTGLNCTIFNEPCEEYTNFAALLTTPGFSRLDLALIVGGQQKMDWSSVRNGRLRRSLASAKDLRHFTFRSTVLSIRSSDANLPGRDGSHTHFIPLQTIFPVDHWSSLTHFGLSRFLVVQSDVISLLSAMPNTIRSIELSFLGFLDDSGTWRDLLIDMRNTLHWHDREVGSRPRVTIGVDMATPRAGFGIWIEDEVCDFLYGGGPNPFSEKFPNDILLSVGIERDTFELEHERPYAAVDVLAQAGFIDKHLVEHYLNA
ncbi:hypothetical protein FE257_003295 [Aspergillus nanangensis]|uniref:F-box domain-containing protein n=1 Tax=Aspergillus nanangensis TaxID=2582783 RepID=A0AAD4CU35_ASPNN|nr:hypothetical protein FE257_003295 [Aspergillus nanangensis]